MTWKTATLIVNRLPAITTGQACDKEDAVVVRISMSHVTVVSCQKYQQEMDVIMDTKYKMKSPYRAGVTMVELIVVMGIFVLLAASIRFFPMEYFYAQSMDNDAAKIAFVLRGAHDRAVMQEQESAWGVHFVNEATEADYYEVFSGDDFASGTVIERVNLNEAIEFVQPPTASTTDVLFSKMTGLPTGAGSIIISIITKPSVSKTITVLGNGQIQY